MFLGSKVRCNTHNAFNVHIANVKKRRRPRRKVCWIAVTCHVFFSFCVYFNLYISAWFFSNIFLHDITYTTVILDLDISDFSLQILISRGTWRSVLNIGYNIIHLFFRCSNADNSTVHGWIWPNIEHICILMVVLITCKNEEDLIKKGRCWIFHYNKNGLAVPEIPRVIAKGRKLVTYFKQSSIVTGMFMRKQMILFQDSWFWKDWSYVD